MATYTITVEYDQELGGLLIGPSTSSNNRLELKPSDILRIQNEGIGTCTLSLLDSNKFSATSLSVAGNSTGSVTVRSNAVLGIDNANINKRNANRAYYLEIVSSVDTTPNTFDIGSPVGSANLSTSYSFEEFLVKGITDPTSWTATNCTVSVNGSAPTSTSGTVNYNDRLYVRGTSSSAYSNSTTQTLVIGGVSNSNTITTKSDPSAGARLSFPIPAGTGNIRITDLTNFFTAPVGHFSNPPRNMSAFRRGGLHVPNITENRGITADSQPTQNNTLRHFRGCKTTFLWLSFPSNKGDSKNTVNSAQSAQVSWSATSDWSLGYSPFTKYNVEYRYVLTEDSSIWTGVTFNSVTGSPGTYGASNISFSVQEDAPRNVEREYRGTVTIYARSLIDSSLVLTTSVRYSLFFYGP